MESLSLLNCCCSMTSPAPRVLRTPYLDCRQATWSCPQSVRERGDRSVSLRCLPELHPPCVLQGNGGLQELPNCRKMWSFIDRGAMEGGIVFRHVRSSLHSTFLGLHHCTLLKSSRRAGGAQANHGWAPWFQVLQRDVTKVTHWQLRLLHHWPSFYRRRCCMVCCLVMAWWLLPHHLLQLHDQLAT